jgi:glycosyltransferase involved in cell wall biosynthesis
VTLPEMPDGVHCYACSQDLSLLRLADVVAHGGSVPMAICWEHVRYCDAPVHPISRPCTDACPIGRVQADYQQPSGNMVSVVTPTWGRHDLLMECIANVRAQTYRPLEHVIVIDGQDEDLYESILAEDARATDDDGRVDVPITCVELGRRWTLELDDSYAAAAMMVAQMVARGEYQHLMADDERWTPFHVELMVRALETTGADFVYPRTAYYRWQTPDQAVGIGVSPPVKGAITTLLYRREVFNTAKGPYRTHTGRENDWDFIERMLNGGASHVFVDRVTTSHRDDRDCPPELYTAQIPEYANA